MAGLNTFPARTPLKAEAPQPDPEDVSEALPDLKDFAWAAPNYNAERAEVVREPEPDEVEEIDSILDEEEPSEPAAPALATLAPFLASLTSAASGRETVVRPDPLELETARELSEDFQSEPAELGPDELLDAPVASQLDPAVIEAIAQRVIERMQPKIIELVTRELLRPAVEALVQRELEKQ